MHSGNTSPNNSFIVFFSGGFLILKAAGVMSNKTIDSNPKEIQCFSLASDFHTCQNVLMRTYKTYLCIRESQYKMFL